MLKILHVIPAVAPRYGGPSQAIFGMCRALRLQDVDVLIATTDADGPSRLAVQTGATIEYHGVPTRFFSGQWGERFNYSPALSRWLISRIGDFDAVHVHAVFSHPCLAAARACRKHTVPYIVRPLGSLDPWSMKQKPLRKRIMWRLAAGRMIENAAAVHYTTDEEKSKAEVSLGIRRGVVIPLGIDLQAFQGGMSAGHLRRRHQSLGDHPYVMALSRIHPKKNYGLLIETFLSLTERPELKQWRLVIAGDGEADYLWSLHALVERSGGREKVIFAGWLESAEKTSALQDASLVVLPSHQENFGIAVAEALACGVPVLVSRQVNLAAEIGEWGAGWVTSLERPAFESALTDALLEEPERRRRGAAGKAFVEQRLSWVRSALELKKLYVSTIKRKEAVLPASDREAECTY